MTKEQTVQEAFIILSSLSQSEFNTLIEKHLNSNLANLFANSNMFNTYITQQNFSNKYKDQALNDLVTEFNNMTVQEYKELHNQATARSQAIQEENKVKGYVVDMLADLTKYPYAKDSVSTAVATLNFKEMKEHIDSNVNKLSKFEKYNYLMDKANYSTLRRGQIVFNTVSEIDLDLANELCNTNLDCFYNDTKIDAFTTEVFSRWKKEGLHER